MLILAIILIIIFIPFPIKLSFLSFDNKLYISIYNIKIDLLKKVSKKPSKKAKKKQDKDKKTAEKKQAKDKKTKLDFLTIRTFINKLNKSKFKPLIRLNFDLEYGFDDAAVTAITYGVISSVSPILYMVVNILFKAKKYKFNIKPNFNFNSFKYKLQIKSIIFISLANVIYMGFKIYNSFRHLQKNNQ